MRIDYPHTLLAERWNPISGKSEPIEVNFTMRTVRVLSADDPLAAEARALRRSLRAIDWDNETAELSLYGVAQDFEKETVKAIQKALHVSES